jgi:hypothetical protein
MQVKDGYRGRLDHAICEINAASSRRPRRGLIMIKDIVANLSVGISREVATKFAVSVAAMLHSHVTGIAFRYEPLVPLTDRYGFPAEVMDSQRVENEKRAKSAMTAFDEAARRAAVSAQSRMLDVPVASAPDVFAKVARRFDLAIMGQPEPDTPALERVLVEAALFDSGRPVLIVPYIQQRGLTLDRVIVAWDGSRSAARAVADAMPLLVRAEAAEILTVASEPAKSDDHRAPSRSPRGEGRSRLDCYCRDRRRQHDPIACRRHLRRFPGHGRLRPFASTRVRSRRSRLSSLCRRGNMSYCVWVNGHCSRKRR